MQANEFQAALDDLEQAHHLDPSSVKIRDLYNEDNVSFAPPILTGEGAKVQPSWLFSFLKALVTLRPWLSVRMPTFHFTDPDATDLVHYFAAASGKSLSALVREILENAVAERSVGRRAGHLKASLRLPPGSSDPWRKAIRDRNWRP